jgi:sulfonate transport system substrate-binding protein
MTNAIQIRLSTGGGPRAAASRGDGAGSTSGRLRAGALAAILLIGGGATACSSSASPPAAAPSPSSAGSAQAVSVSNVTLHIGDQAGSGAEALLTAAGLIGKLPFKADWSDFTSGPPMLQAMGAGSIDIGSVGDAPPVFAAAGGSQIAVVGALQTDPNSAALLVPDNSPIHSVAQLKGKSIAVTQGSSADYHLLATLTKAGLSIKDVTPDYLQPAEAVAAFSSGHVAAWDIWTPYIEQAETQYHARIIANGSGIGETYSFVVASRAALADPARAAAIRDYLTLLDEAYTWAATHQSTWAATWAKATGLPLSVMVQAVKDDQDTPIGITPAVISSEQAVANAFSTAGLIPGKVDFSDFAVTTFNGVTGGAS